MKSKGGFRLKKFWGIVILVISSVLLLLSFILLLVLLTEFDLAMLLFVVIIFLTPGILLLIWGIKLVMSPPKKVAFDTQGFNPYDPHSVNNFVNNQMNNGNVRTVRNPDGSITRTVVNSTSSSSSTSTSHQNLNGNNVNVNELVQSFFGNSGFSSGGGMSVSREPISVECSGCGSKTMVYPNQQNNCDFCGNLVTDK